MIVRVWLFTCFAVASVMSGTWAQTPGGPGSKPEMRESCPGMVAGNVPRVLPVAARLTALASDQVRITFIGHATFLIESPRLVRIATDYNDYVKPPVMPDIVTMNHAHSTHYTDRPDAAIKYVLRGWRDDGKPATYDITYEDVRVRNVPTNIRDWNGGTERNGNSIFIFEVGGLCIAHLGHLHHTLTQQQLDDMGRIDVVMAPVDGSYTLDIDGMIEVLSALKAPLIIPMHFFSTYGLDRFLRNWGRNIRSTIMRHRRWSSRARPCRQRPRWWCCRGISSGTGEREQCRYFSRSRQ
jgi:L-ascorbate metabolism protein UlaG (beta-lactamase superfamily)